MIRCMRVWILFFSVQPKSIQMAIFNSMQFSTKRLHRKSNLKNNKIKNSMNEFYLEYSMFQSYKLPSAVSTKLFSSCYSTYQHLLGKNIFTVSSCSQQAMLGQKLNHYFFSLIHPTFFIKIIAVCSLFMDIPYSSAKFKLICVNEFIHSFLFWQHNFSNLNSQPNNLHNWPCCTYFSNHLNVLDFFFQRWGDTVETWICGKIMWKQIQLCFVRWLGREIDIYLYLDFSHF